jgi:hypothetical protein
MLSPTSIPISPNYFDVLLEEEDVPPERTLLMETESELPGTQRAMDLILNLKGKAPMSLLDLEVEASGEELQLALHLSCLEVERNNRQKEASGRPLSLTNEPTTPRTSG